MDRVDYESLVIQDLENIYKREELELTPWYQRRSVWSDAQRGYLINSLFANAPIPTCYIRHYLDVEAEKSIKEVVDGQQRLRAILDYLADEFPAPLQAGGKKVYFTDLTPAQRTEFKMKKLSVGTLVGATDADVIDIFGRINSVAKVLKPQEKRNAAYSGAMKQFCLRLGAKYVNFWRETNLFTPTDISRMEEVQFASDLVLNMLAGELQDFSQAKLNKLYKTYDDDFEEGEEIASRFEAVMTQFIELSDTVASSIFNRSPIFFSMFLIADEWDIELKALRDVMIEVDAIFHSVAQEEDQPKAAVDFYEACRASTQRIKSRRVRDDYLRSWFE